MLFVKLQLHSTFISSTSLIEYIWGSSDNLGTKLFESYLQYLSFSQLLGSEKNVSENNRNCIVNLLSVPPIYFFVHFELLNIVVPYHYSF